MEMPDGRFIYDTPFKSRFVSDTDPDLKGEELVIEGYNVCSSCMRENKCYIFHFVNEKAEKTFTRRHPFAYGIKRTGFYPRIEEER